MYMLLNVLKIIIKKGLNPASSLQMDKGSAKLTTESVLTILEFLTAGNGTLKIARIKKRLTTNFTSSSFILHS